MAEPPGDLPPPPANRGVVASKPAPVRWYVVAGTAVILVGLAAVVMWGYLQVAGDPCTTEITIRNDTAQPVTVQDCGGHCQAAQPVRDGDSHTIGAGRSERFVVYEESRFVLQGQRPARRRCYDPGFVGDCKHQTRVLPVSAAEPC